MEYLLSQIVKYIVIILFLVYTLSSYVVLRNRMEERKRRRIYRAQIACMLVIHFLCYLVIAITEENFSLWILWAAGVGLVILIYVIYGLIYKNDARLITNHMCMLILIGMIFLTRLDASDAIRQLEIAAIAMVISIFVPVLIARFKYLRRFTWVYGIVGILALGVVLALGQVTGGAKLSFTVAGITLQPSEFVKLLFVFFVACMLIKARDFKDILIATVLAAIHVILLVGSTDLGAALIFYITYVIMLYCATRKGIYLLGGIGVGAVAAVAAAKVFSHVQVRVEAWLDPLGNIADSGYQVSHSLFAIGTGGWLGTGLYQGMPEKIPVVESDFIFSGIAEEFGGIFAICLILVCFSCVVMMTNVAMQIRDLFYKLIALGFGSVYAIQVFLNIGGVIKCIPSTGVTLPFISSGGSSIFVTIIMFAIVQGLYIYRHIEGDIYEEQIRSGKRPIRTIRYEPQNGNNAANDRTKQTTDTKSKSNAKSKSEDKPIRSVEYKPGSKNKY